MNNARQNSTTTPDWQPVPDVPGVFEIQRSHGPLPLRAVAVQLRPVAVCVYSPVPRAGNEAMSQLRSWGKPILLASNAFHTLGLPEHAAAFADARVVASERASARIKRKTGLVVENLDVLREQLPNHVLLLELPPVRSGEVWLCVRGSGSCAWIVCDGLLNVQPSPSGLLGLAMKLMRMGPGLSISSSFRWMVKDRRAYREWLLARIEEDQPTILIPSHGQIIHDRELPSRLTQLAKDRL